MNMDYDALLESFLEALEKRAGSPLPRLGRDGAVSLSFGESLEFVLEHEDGSPWVHLHADLGTLPDGTSGNAVLRTALEKNFPSGPLHGASLSLEPGTDTLFIAVSILLEGLTDETFCNAVTNFAVIAEESRRDLL